VDFNFKFHSNRTINKKLIVFIGGIKPGTLGKQDIYGNVIEPVGSVSTENYSFLPLTVRFV
uniref:hypothetical protein n=1 Tax=Klebsiella pneumoniae TaxID=573 RepID=UPI001C8F7B1A